MSLEIDELINIRRVLKSEYTGFEKCLEKYQNDSPKKYAFINQCQKIIENGWNKEIYDIDDEVRFFSRVLNPLLVDPNNIAAFRYKKNFSPNDKKFVNFFTRVFLFQLLFHAHKNNPCVKNGHIWFAQMKSNLDKAFESICDFFSTAPVIYNGKAIKNIEELEGAINENRKICLNYKASYGKELGIIPGVIGIALFGYLISGSESDQSGWKSTALAFLACSIIIYKMYLVRQSSICKEAKQSLASLELHKADYQKYKEIASVEDIKKSFFVNDEEISALSVARDDHKDSSANDENLVLSGGMGNRGK